MNQAKVNPRRVAVRTLREVEQRAGFSNRILSANLERHPELARRDRALITNLVYGVLRQRARLDALIDAAADKPKKIKGELRTILRLAAYEIVELERPLGIASSEATKLSQRIDPKRRLVGLITAVLGGVTRSFAQADAAALAGAPLGALVRRYSLPPWLAARWLAQLGPETAMARARALIETPTVDLRVDRDRGEVTDVREALLAEAPTLRFVELPEAAGEQPQCLRIRGGGDLFYGPTFESGHVSIQSLGSQQAVRALDPQPGEIVLDACAGMGTKTVQIAEHLGRRGTLVAVDASGERLAELELARARAGLDTETLTLEIHEAVLGAGPVEGLSPGRFDAVLLDAPCTGLGNLARHPELRWTSEPSNITACATLQAALIQQCAEWVRPGGRLVYAVCSLEPEEGPAILDGFLASPAGAEFEVELRQAWTPEQHHTDGFWLARLRRESST